MLERVAQNITTHCRIDSGEPVLLAVSGGLDSMVLLEIMSQLAVSHSWKIGVGHVNHNLRGAESDADCAFVRESASKLNLPFFSRSVDVQHFAAENGISIEMAARELRFQALATHAKEFGSNKIALAHHSDDQVELFWMRLLRGNAGEGLRGMKWISDLPIPDEQFQRLKLVRPMLNLSRSEIAEFASSTGVGFREDSTNLTTDYQRNQIRHEVLPTLRNYQPGLNEITVRLMDVLGSEKDFLRSCANQWLSENRIGFDSLHIAVQREVIFVQLIKLGVKPNYELVERLRTSPKEIINVSPSRFISRAADGRLNEKLLLKTTFNSGEVEIDLTRSGELEFAGRRLKWWHSSERGTENGVEYFDACRLGNCISIRHWAPGDRMQPIGMTQSVKLQDLFTNAKVPRVKRFHYLLAVSESNEVFWVEGLRISEKFKVTPQTDRVLAWKCEPLGT
jgi:tRNA(Ile)-lysidine synthase